MKAYQDGGGIWTIGFGHTQGVKEGDTCTQSQAYNWLDTDLNTAVAAINRLVTVPLTQNQVDALTSLVYNIGSGHFASSTVLRLLNGANYDGAADAILMWDKVAGVESAGLVRRRTAERDLFLTPGEQIP